MYFGAGKIRAVSTQVTKGIFSPSSTNPCAPILFRKWIIGIVRRKCKAAIVYNQLNSTRSKLIQCEPLISQVSKPTQHNKSYSISIWLKFQSDWACGDIRQLTQSSKVSFHPTHSGFLDQGKNRTTQWWTTTEKSLAHVEKSVLLKTQSLSIIPFYTGVFSFLQWNNTRILLMFLKCATR